MATHRIVFVSDDDTCLSPYLAVSLSRLLPPPPPGVEWDISTAGTALQQSRSACERLVARAVGSGADFLRSHRSQPIRVSDVARAHLLLTTTTAERAAVAGLAPDARSRTFTVREAVLLGSTDVTLADVRAVAVPGRPAASLRTFADMLHHRRGTLALARARWTPLRREGADELDLPDPHRSSRSHDRVLDRIDPDIRRLGAQLGAFVRLTGPGDGHHRDLSGDS